MAPKRKSDTNADGEKPKKVVPKKIPKMVKAKILMLLAEAEKAMDIATIKLALADKYEFPDNEENKNKVWKALKDMGNSENFGRVGILYHGGEGTASFLSITPEDYAKAEEEKKKPVEKYTCPDCDCFDYYCQVSETLPGPHEGSTETTYKCLNSCYREFKVLVHGNKRIYSHGYGFDETTEKIVDEPTSSTTST